MHRNLIVDLHNMIFRMRFTKLKTPSRNQRKEIYAKEIIFKEVIGSIATLAVANKADGILIALDSPNVWRKDYLDTYKERDEERDVYYRDCIDAASLCAEFFNTCTNSSVVKVARAEADDIIAVACQMNPGTVENIIISSDKDYVQLINEHTKLYSPQQKAFRESDDPAYDLFVKCIRGDTNDNVPTAFYKVRESRLKKAWDDPHEMQALMESMNPKGRPGKVADLYEENRKLIDLTLQPTDIRMAIEQEIIKEKKPAYSQLGIKKFLTDHNLKAHSNMFDMRDKPLRGKFRYK